FLDRGENVERGGVTVWVLAGGKRLRLLPPLAAGDVGEQLKQHVRSGPEGDAVDEHIAQHPSADREIRRRLQRGNDGVDQRRVLARKYAEGVADRILDAAPGQIELNMPSLFPGAGLVEARARQKHGLGRLARTARRG